MLTIWWKIFLMILELKLCKYTFMLQHNLQAMQVRDKVDILSPAICPLLFLKHKVDVGILTVCGNKVRRFLKN